MLSPFPFSLTLSSIPNVAWVSYEPTTMEKTSAGEKEGPWSSIKESKKKLQKEEPELGREIIKSTPEDGLKLWRMLKRAPNSTISLSVKFLSRGIFQECEEKIIKLATKASCELDNLKMWGNIHKNVWSS